MSKSIIQIKSILSKKGYPFFDNNTPFNFNIIGVRNISSKSNSFDDEIYLIYRDEKLNWQIKCYKATTDPGKYWLNNPMNIDGTAILTEGFHKALWKRGFHQGKYKALVQNSPALIYRDNDKDNELDFNSKSLRRETIGLNFHHAGNNSQNVDKWSAACQVTNDEKQYNEEIYPLLDKCPFETFSYTLLNEKDFYL